MRRSANVIGLPSGRLAGTRSSANGAEYIGCGGKEPSSEYTTVSGISELSTADWPERGYIAELLPGAGAYSSPGPEAGRQPTAAKTPRARKEKKNGRIFFLHVNTEKYNLYVLSSIGETITTFFRHIAHHPHSLYNHFCQKSAFSDEGPEIEHDIG
jgi:hypothetical protein